MSLNKLTDTQKGLDLLLKIGADEVKCNTLTADNISFDALTVENLTINQQLDADDIKADTVVSQSITATNELKAGDIEYPTSVNPAFAYQYVGSVDGGPSLSMIPSTSGATYGFARANAVGGLVPLSNFGSFTESDTNGNLYSLPDALYTQHPKGINILKNAIYRITATVRFVRSIVDESNYCAILKNGSSTQQALTTCPSINTNSDMAFSITDYMTLDVGDRVSVGLSGLSGGTVQFEYWKLDIEFIRDF